MEALFNRFSVRMTKEQALSGSHQGRCDEDVEELVKLPAIRRQLDKIPADDIRKELREYGAWDDQELSDDQENRLRLIWIACGNIKEELHERERNKKKR